MSGSLVLLRAVRELDITVTKGLELILEAVEGGSVETASWLLERDVELIAERYGTDGLLDTNRLAAAVVMAGELVPEAVR